MPAHREILHDVEHGYRIYRLEQPLAPGAEMELGFDLTVEPRGFVNRGGDTKIVRNGTYFKDRDYLPHFGYYVHRELGDRNLRRKHDLPPVERSAAVDDLRARRYFHYKSDAPMLNMFCYASADYTVARAR